MTPPRPTADYPAWNSRYRARKAERERENASKGAGGRDFVSLKQCPSLARREGEDHYNVEMPNFSLRLLKTDGGRGGGDKGKNPFAICDFFKVGRRL